MGNVASHPGASGGQRLTAGSSALDMGVVWANRLRAFRASHHQQTRSIGKQVWPFLLGGEGAGAALLLHGSASDGESLFGLMAPLERAYRVLAPTYPDGVSDITSVVDGLADLLDELDMPPALVVGYSLGGYLAQTLAWRHPERVAAMALLNTGGPAPSAARAATFQNLLLTALTGGLLNAAARAGAAAQLRLEAPDLDPSAVTFWRGYLSEMARRVGKERMLTHGRLVVDFLRKPVDAASAMCGRPKPETLIVSSARDRTIEAAERRALDTLYPHAARVMEPNAGHLSVPTQPERYLAAIEATFLSPHATRSDGPHRLRRASR